MGRGKQTLNSSKVIFSQQLRNNSEINREHFLLDESPYLEKWFSLNDYLESKAPVFVSIEAKPKYLKLKKDWNYRAMIHSPDWTKQKEFQQQSFEGSTPEEALKKAAEAAGEIVIDPVLEDAEPNVIGLHPTVEPESYLSENYEKVTHYDDLNDWRKNHIRLKPVPEIKQKGSLKWFYQEFCDSRDNGEGTDKNFFYTEDGLNQNS